MIRSRKLALFLSTELIIAIIIITSLFAVVISGSLHGIKIYKIYKISKEYSEYSRAIVNFKYTYGYYPGDLAISDMNLDLNDTILKSNLQNVLTGLPNSYSNMFIYPQTGHIDGRKSQLAFQQLIVGKFLEIKINQKYSISSQCEPFNANIGNTIPKSSFADYSSFSIGIDYSNLDSSSNNNPKDSILYNNAIYPSLIGKVRLIFYRYTSTNTCVVSTSSGEIGVLTSEMAHMLDDKIDDGFPLEASGIIFSENYTGLNGNGCIDNGSGDITKAKYIPSSSDTGLKDCIITFVIK